MKKSSFVIVLFFLSTLLSNLSAQVELKETESPVDVAIELKNAHIWRGLDVTHNLLIDANVRLADKTNTFALGLWGATTFTSDFREFDYYVGFYKGNFSLEVWDIFNFSEKNEFDPVTNTGYNTQKAFDYSAHGTGHFVDVRLAYTISKSFPLRLGWNTIVFGRDRARFSIPDSANPTSYNQAYSSSRYSTYVEAEYPILKGNIVDVKAGIAGAFALKEAKIDGQKIKGHFYGESAGIVNANLTVTKNLKLGEHYNLPVSVTAVWNPEANKTYMQIALQVLQF